MRIIEHIRQFLIKLLEKNVDEQEEIDGLVHQYKKIMGHDGKTYYLKIKENGK